MQSNNVPMIRRKVSTVRIGLRIGSALIFVVSHLAFLVPQAASAGGVREINHVCAVETGCFMGDNPGYPVSIGVTTLPPASYRLTSDLVVPDGGISGIVVTNPNTHIDLNGFEIIRAGCVGATSSCAPPSVAGDGINGDDGMSIRNGRITGMGRGIWTRRFATISEVDVRWSFDVGIEVQSGSVVDSLLYQNGSWGIQCLSSPSVGCKFAGNISVENLAGMFGADASVISHNAAARNTGAGIVSQRGSNVFVNAASRNGARGIDVDRGSSAVGNAAFANLSTGIRAEFSCNVKNNSANGNLTGVSAGLYSHVQGNAIAGNSSIGFIVSSLTVTRDNVIDGTTVTGIGVGVDMGGNSCNGTTTCP